MSSTDKPAWTPEPWQACESSLGTHSVYGPDKANGFPPVATMRHWGRAPANAQRIVACVNACAGIANPAAIPELLAAAKGAMEYLDEYGSLCGVRLRQALAALEAPESKP